MTIHLDKLLAAVMVVCDKADMKVCVKESLKASALVGVSTLLGGLFGGRTGLLLGGAVGGVAAAAMCDEFKSATQIISGLSKSEKTLLYNNLVDAFEDVGIGDVLKIVSLLSRGQLENIALDVVKNYLTDKGYSLK